MDVGLILIPKLFPWLIKVDKVKGHSIGLSVEYCCACKHDVKTLQFVVAYIDSSKSLIKFFNE